MVFVDSRKCKYKVSSRVPFKDSDSEAIMLFFPVKLVKRFLRGSFAGYPNPGPVRVQVEILVPRLIHDENKHVLERKLDLRRLSFEDRTQLPRWSLKANHHARYS